MSEAGFPGFVAEVLYGLLAPAGTPEVVLGRTNAEINRALDAPERRAAMARSGVAIGGGSASDFAAFPGHERLKWSRAVADSGATVD